jgi:hypothetical protein
MQMKVMRRNKGPLLTNAGNPIKNGGKKEMNIQRTFP